jgi:hypothetical protein
MRVQIPAYHDHWMRGDRFGEVVKTETRHHYTARHADGAVSEGGHYKSRKQTEIAAEEARWLPGIVRVVVCSYQLAHVRLDKSGKTGRFLLDECTPV